ncbi:hypothetical protein J2790_001085 [Paenarthrobacter nicotinovorans]|uniref:DM13 domain-containing protein n=1 Tax=Micrococcaceae TaxID=1268 RepID=UPI000876BF2E|nr:MULTISPECIES: DM13 domain-containing protein [Micrococcaceae]MDR6435964.1 hypothetical protein [Paenarthrobacter nicotinovorans]SCZ51220.1 Electron transfer DM13 [Arthrobacter sp. UNCCL28]
MNRIRIFIRSHRALAAVIAVMVLAAVMAGAALFQPWRIFTSSNVNEALPVVEGPANTSSGGGTAAASPGNTATQPTNPQPTNPQPTSPLPTNPIPSPAILKSGAFESQEHETTGSAQLLALPDGSHVLRLENLASSDGPDVKVWLSSLEAGGDWFKYRSGAYVDLGSIKATHGNHNCAIPAGTDVSGLTSVVLWCDRFSVAFGSAPLA